MEHSLAVVGTNYVSKIAQIQGLYPFTSDLYAEQFSKPDGRFYLSLIANEFKSDVNFPKISPAKEEERQGTIADRVAAKASYDAAKAVPMMAIQPPAQTVCALLLRPGRRISWQLMPTTASLQTWLTSSQDLLLLAR